MTVEALANSRFRLRTLWRDGSIYYQFDVEGFPPVIDQAREQASQAAFLISLLDKDGFKLFEHSLPLAQMEQIMGTNPQVSGLSWKGDEYLGADVYRRASKWELEW